MADLSTDADVLLNITSALGEVVDNMLDDKITMLDVKIVDAAARTLNEYFPMLLAKYISYYAGDEFFAQITDELRRYRG